MQILVIVRIFSPPHWNGILLQIVKICHAKKKCELCMHVWWRSYFPVRCRKILFTRVDVFLNSANFAPHALLTLAPPSGYALNLKALIKVSKVSWTSQLSYEILRSSFERKFDKANFISPKRTPPKSSHCLGFMGSS